MLSFKIVFTLNLDEKIAEHENSIDIDLDIQKFIANFVAEIKHSD